jgi:hypothetical protein
VHVLRAFLAMLILACAPASGMAEEERAWRLSEAKDGKHTAQLIYGLPGYEGIQVSAECDGAVANGNAIARLVFITDIGALAAGKETDLRFTGGGFERVAKGRIARLQGEGGTGVALTITVADAFWELLSLTEGVDYMVPGYRASALPLAQGRSQIRAFLDACKKLVADSGATSADAAQKKSEADVKAAFAGAKELGTADAWRAFLANYPDGFHADLARAFLKRAEQAGERPADTRKPN